MAQGLNRDKLLAIVGISKNQFYHVSHQGRRGRKRSKTTTRMEAGGVVEYSNRALLGHIRSKYAGEEAIDYGYRKMTAELQLDGFLINHKKVYRLMKNNHLLRVKPEQVSKQWVKYRIFVPEGPFRIFEMDIKQIWLEKEGRYLYVLTILDVFTRIVLHQSEGYSMTQIQVQAAWQEVIETWLEPLNMYARDIHIEIRSDNGPQFCAKKLQEFFVVNKFVRTFTHPYTPQENGHVESYHAILVGAMRNKLFDNRQQLVRWLEEFLVFYNYRRLHSAIALLPPMTFLEQWQKGNIEIIEHPKNIRRVRLKLTIPRHQVTRVSQQAMRA